MPRFNQLILTISMAVVAMAFCVVPFHAETADSLRRQLPTMKKAQRLKAYETLLELSLEEDDVDYQLRCANDYLAEARRQKNNDEIINAMAQRAVIFYNNDMNDSILTVVRKDLEIVKTSKKKRSVYYEMWGHIPNTYIFMGQNNLGLRETQAMFNDAKSHNDAYGMGLAYSIMGTAYANLHNYDQSIESFQKSISVLSKQKEIPSFLTETYVYYGNALNDMKAYDRLEKLTAQWKAFNQKVIQKNHLEGTPSASVLWSYYYLARVQAALGLSKLKEAEDMLGHARENIYTLEGIRGGKWLYYTAQLNLQLGKYNKALAYNNMRTDQMTEGTDRSVVVMVREQRAEIMEKLQRYEEAAALYKSIYLLNDSMNAQDTKNQLNEMNTIFQVNELEMEKEREVNKLEMEKEREKMRYIYIGLSLLALALAIFLFFRFQAARKLKQAHTKLQSAYTDLQAANEVIEQTTAAKERIESELRIARDIQMGMVPATFPERPDVDLFASMTPAKEVGGDLYDYLLIEGTDKAAAQLYFCLGDVSGKGVPASLFMSQATRLFRALAKQQLMPAEIATRLNAELTESNDSGMFVTMFIGLADLSTGHLHFCNAGHNPPVLLKDGDAVFLEMEPNAPIGLWPGLEYEGEQIDTIMNQPLFIYTDGLNEAENRQQEQFSDERLLELLKQTPFESSQQIIGFLKEEVEKHRDGADPNDDLTMLCLKLCNTH